MNEYKPDFSPGIWSARDRHFLEAFATNPDGIVSVLRNLPPEITGALCSRASRASGSLLEVLLKEYIYPIVDGEDRKLAGDLEETVQFLKEHGFKNILNNQRAQAFYSKWLSQYGDDSIAQVTGTHVILWGISQVAMKFIEDQRVGLEPIEKSTRYVNFGTKVGGRYLYYIPEAGSRAPRFARGIRGGHGQPVRYLRGTARPTAGMAPSELRRQGFDPRKEGVRYAARTACRWQLWGRWPFAETRRRLNT